MIVYIVLIIAFSAGYPAYLSFRGKALQRKIERMVTDPDRIMRELDSEIARTKSEGQFFEKQSGKGPWF